MYSFLLYEWWMIHKSEDYKKSILQSWIKRYKDSKNITKIEKEIQCLAKLQNHKWKCVRIIETKHEHFPKERYKKLIEKHLYILFYYIH